MIKASEFLATAALHGDEEALFVAALKAIAAESERCKREYTGFKVPMPMSAITPNVAAAIRIHLRHDGWDVQAHQVQEQSRLDASVKFSWIVLVMPTDDVSNAAAVRFKEHGN